MLDVARDVLIDAGVLAPRDPLPHFAARMSGNVGLLFYLDNGESFLAKIGLLTRLDREYRGLAAAYRAMPSNVPEPIRLATCRRYQVLVTRGIRHAPVLPLRGATNVAAFEQGVSAYLETSARAFARSNMAPSLDTIRAALRSANERVQWPGWAMYYEGIRNLVERLTPVEQHGDLSVNNIGVRDGALVFFDWEDFGEIDLPGFDLAVLLLSINEFSYEKLAAKLERPTMEADIARRGCAAFGMAAPEFLRLFGAYASLYIETKTRLGYPERVTDRAIAALQEWIRLAPQPA